MAFLKICYNLTAKSNAELREVEILSKTTTIFTALRYERSGAAQCSGFYGENRGRDCGNSIFSRLETGDLLFNRLTMDRNQTYDSISVLHPSLQTPQPLFKDIPTEFHTSGIFL